MISVYAVAPGPAIATKKKYCISFTSLIVYISKNTQINK